MSKNQLLKSIEQATYGKNKFIPALQILKMSEEMGRKVKIPGYVTACLEDSELLLKALKRYVKTIDNEIFYKTFIKQMMFDNKGGKHFRSKTTWSSFPISTRWDNNQGKLAVYYDTVKTHEWCMENILVFKDAPALTSLK